jgi:hypothetical protein
MVATMLGWSVAPPPAQHRHIGGTDLSHQHESATTGFGCQPPRATDGGLNQAVAVGTSMIGGEASHLHFQWLGFRLTLPDDSPTKKGEDRSPSKLLFVQASRASVPQAHTGGRLDTSLTLLPRDLVAADIASSCARVFCSLLWVESHPLCDRARHERSGVQLS